MSIAQVGEVRQGEKLLPTCPNSLIASATDHAGERRALCLPLLSSTPLPHFIPQMFSAGASLSALPVGSVVHRLFVEGWLWALLKQIRVLPLISFPIPASA